MRVVPECDCLYFVLLCALSNYDIGSPAVASMLQTIDVDFAVTIPHIIDMGLLIPFPILTLVFAALSIGRYDSC